MWFIFFPLPQAERPGGISAVTNLFFIGFYVTLYFYYTTTGNIALFTPVDLWYTSQLPFTLRSDMNRIDLYNTEKC